MMVKFGKIPRPEPEPVMASSPYDLVTVFVGVERAQARPYEFDSEAITQDAHNAQGLPIRPVKAMTSCPNCGAGIDVDLRQGLCVGCDGCGLGQQPLPAPLSDPFCNPLADGRITEVQLLEAETTVLVQEVDLVAAPAKPRKKAKRVVANTKAGEVAGEESAGGLGSVLDMGPEPE